jgi:hypothetical protein
MAAAAPEMIETAASLHKEAHAKCFIANSVNFPVRHESVVTAAAANGKTELDGLMMPPIVGYRAVAVTDKWAPLTARGWS